MKLLLSLILGVTSCFAGEYTPYKYDVSIVAITQNEAPYLKEWIDYHLKVGVNHFWIYTNNCEDNTNEVLKPYVDSGTLEVIDWPSQLQDNEYHDFTFVIQPGSYNDCMNRSRGISKFVAVIDTDEYIVAPSKEPLGYILESKYSNVSGLFLNWQCYGTSNEYADLIDGHKYITHKLLNKMRWNQEWNCNGKLIVQPEHVTSFWYPHDCYFTENHWSVNTNYLPHPRGGNNPVLIDTLRLNHYWARDLEFFHTVKMKRYSKWNSSDANECIRRESEMNFEYDPIIIQ